MRHVTLLFACLCCFWSNVASNPKIDPFYEAGISEVYIANPAIPIDWYIELDGNWCLFDLNAQRVVGAFPCTTSVYLRIKSHYSSYGIMRAKVPFSANKIGVLSRTSLNVQQRNPSDYICLDPEDTVMVALDSLQLKQSSSSATRVQYWSIQLRAVPVGNSLVVVRDRNYRIAVYSTKRRSIGMPNNYATKYKFSILDNYGKPLKDIRAIADWSNNTHTDSSGVCFMSISLTDPDTVAKFYDPFAAHSEEIQISSFPLSYNDEDTLVSKNFKIPVTHYEMAFVSPYSNGAISCYKQHDVAVYSEMNIREYNKINTFYWRVYPSMPVCSLCFALDHPGNASCLSTWSGGYIDTSDVIKKEVTIDVTAISQDAKITKANSAITITPVVRSHREISVIISSPYSLKNASVSLCTMDGKEIRTQPVCMNKSGTNTALLQFFNKNLSSGKYLCMLRSEGYSPVISYVAVQ